MVGVICRFGRFIQPRSHAVPRRHDQSFSKLRQVVLLLVSASIAVISGCASLAGPKYVSPNPIETDTLPDNRGIMSLPETEEL